MIFKILPRQNPFNYQIAGFQNRQRTLCSNSRPESCSLRNGFYGKPITYRTTDFKSNEYRNLLGGNLFEHIEANPMLGYRGVSRNIHDWEIEAFKLARGVYGGRNLRLMLPFVRTLEEARSMRCYLDQVHKLKSDEDGLKIILMSELPSNAILSKQFISEFDGFSIGSNDMTQMVLATDRDNSRLSHIYDEEDPAVIWAILVTIFTGQKYCKKSDFADRVFQTASFYEDSLPLLA